MTSSSGTNSAAERVRVVGDVAYVTLTKGYTAIIDAADASFVAQWKWYAREQPHTVYVARKARVTEGPLGACVYLHRALMEPPAGVEVDHITRNALDNRRANLRIVTRMENAQNRYSCTPGGSGVSFSATRRKWRAYIYVKGRQRYLGSFDTPQEARQARVAAEKSLGWITRSNGT